MKHLIKKSALSLAVIVTMTGQSFAQFVSPAANNPSSLLGDNTAGAESGIYEFFPLVVTGAVVGMAIVLGFVGWKLTRRVGNKVG